MIFTKIKQMKNYLLLLLAAFALTACKKNTTEAKEAGEKNNIDNSTGTELLLNIADSYVTYNGTKKIGGGHNGKVILKEGKFLVKDNQLVDGEFIIDMNTITNEDLPEDKKADLVGHLKGADFFDVENFPTAKFSILSVSGVKEDGMFDISGNLTIKNTVKEITVPAAITVDGSSVSLSSTFSIDRTDFNIVYGSNSDKNPSVADLAKDRIINDAVELSIVAQSK